MANARNIRNIVVPKGIRDEIIMEFKNLTSYKETLEEIRLKIEDPVSYPSPMADMGMNIQTSGRKLWQPERDTIHLDNDKARAFTLELKINALENALLTAAKEAKGSKMRIKVKKALKLNLVDGFAGYDVNISDHSLTKYRDLAITHAAINLGLIDYDYKL